MLNSQIKQSKSCDIDLSDFNECKSCEYKHRALGGCLVQWREIVMPPLGDTQKRMGLELQHRAPPSAQQTPLATLRVENVPSHLPLQITVTHYAGPHRTKPLRSSVVTPSANCFTKCTRAWSLSKEQSQVLSPGRWRSRNSLQCPQTYLGDSDDRTWWDSRREGQSRRLVTSPKSQSRRNRAWPASLFLPLEALIIEKPLKEWDFYLNLSPGK